MSGPAKARLFHLTREESALGDALPPQVGTASGIRVEVERNTRAPVSDDLPFSAGATDDGFGSFSMTGAAPQNVQPNTTSSAQGATGADLDAAIVAVRAENLTARQLRIAERMAIARGHNITSEYEAVVRLREEGLDPFDRGNLFRALRSLNAPDDAPTTHQQVPSMPETSQPPMTQSTTDPATQQSQALARIEPAQVPAPASGRGIGRPRGRQLPTREEMGEERRAAEIRAIQMDLARRRRRRMMMLVMRLFLLIGIPTIIAGWYFANIASPLYATHSQFLIQIPEGSKAQTSGTIFTTNPMMTNTDSVAVQSYLLSRDAMLRLDREHGFRKAFQDPALDALVRLPADATNEDTYKRYKRSVKIGYDPTEGVITMDVIAPDAKLSEDFSLALISYAEGQVDSMSSRLRDDQMKGAQKSYEAAEQRVKDSQTRLQELQTKLGILNPESEGAALLGRVNSLEAELVKKRLELGQLQSNASPNASRVAGVRGDISRIESMIADTRGKMTEATAQKDSLAVISGEIRLAESDLETRQKLLMSAAEQVDAARIEANKQVRYLSLSVAPVPPDVATYPKVFENTLVAFFVLCGIYLMLSLTASILREQVST